MKTLYSDNAEGRKMVKFLLEISFPGVCYGFYELCSIYLTFWLQGKKSRTSYLNQNVELMQDPGCLLELKDKNKWGGVSTILDQVELLITFQPCLFVLSSFVILSPGIFLLSSMQ